MCVFSGDDSATAAGVNDIRQHAGLAERFAPSGSAGRALVAIGDQKMLVPKKAPTMPKPVWHRPWKLFRVRFHSVLSSVCIIVVKFMHFAFCLNFVMNCSNWCNRQQNQVDFLLDLVKIFLCFSCYLTKNHDMGKCQGIPHTACRLVSL